MGVELRNISKRYGKVTAVHDCSLRVDKGELIVLAGPSGCGKSTFLRILAGLLCADAGQVFIDGECVDDRPTRERGVAFIMETWGLYPHLDVFSNVGYPLRVRRVAKKDVDRRVREIAEVLEIHGLLDRRPGELSAGQKQRVAIARALVRDDAKVLLADEPFSNLDQELRFELRARFKEVQRKRGLTCICVTHSQADAQAIGDRIAVMDEGQIVQVGNARELYCNPQSTVVARLLGQPAMNLLPATLTRGQVVVGDELVCTCQQGMFDGDREILLGVRPDALELAEEAEGGIVAEVALVERSEPDQFVHVKLGEHRLVAKTKTGDSMASGQTIALRIPANACYFFDPTTGDRIPGGDVSLGKTS